MSGRRCSADNARSSSSTAEKLPCYFPPIMVIVAKRLRGPVGLRKSRATQWAMRVSYGPLLASWLHLTAKPVAYCALRRGFLMATAGSPSRPFPDPHSKAGGFAEVICT